MIKTTFFVSCIAAAASAVELGTCASALTEIMTTVIDNNYARGMVVTNRA